MVRVRNRHSSSRSAKVVIGAAAVAAGLGLASCGDEGELQSERSDARLEVVASFYPLAEVATRVGGSHVRVVNLTPVGAEPHDVELTTRQVDRIEDADVVLYLGKGFQPSVATTAAKRRAGSIDLLERVDLQGSPPSGEEEHEANDSARAGEDTHEDDQADPHFWLNPVLMVQAVGAIADALAQSAPDRAEEFRGNARAYALQLSELDAEFERGLAACDRREIVTSHAAFFYLAERYRLRQLPIAGLSPDAEPDARRIADLSDTIKEKGVTVVFYEENVPPEIAETLAREAGVSTAVLSPLEGLTKEQTAAGKDYLAVMRDNLAALRSALGCR